MQKNKEQIRHCLCNCYDEIKHSLWIRFHFFSTNRRVFAHAVAKNKTHFTVFWQNQYFFSNNTKRFSKNSNIYWALHIMIPSVFFMRMFWFSRSDVIYWFQTQRPIEIFLSDLMNRISKFIRNTFSWLRFWSVECSQCFCLNKMRKH